MSSWIQNAPGLELNHLVKTYYRDFDQVHNGVEVQEDRGFLRSAAMKRNQRLAMVQYIKPNSIIIWATTNKISNRMTSNSSKQSAPKETTKPSVPSPVFSTFTRFSSLAVLWSVTNDEVVMNYWQIFDYQCLTSMFKPWELQIVGKCTEPKIWFWATLLIFLLTNLCKWCRLSTYSVPL